MNSTAEERELQGFLDKGATRENRKEECRVTTTNKIDRKA